MTQLCSVAAGTVKSYSTGFIRAAQIDVTTLGSSPRITSLGYQASSASGNVKLALYVNGVKQGETPSTAVVSGNNFIDMTSSVAISNTDTVYVGQANSTTADYGTQLVDGLKYYETAYANAFPTNLSSYSDHVSDKIRVCISTSGTSTAGVRLPPPPIVVRF